MRKNRDEFVQSIRDYARRVYEENGDDPSAISNRLNTWLPRQLKKEIGIDLTTATVSGKPIKIVEMVDVDGELMSPSTASQIVLHCIDSIKSLGFKHHRIAANIARCHKELGGYYSSDTLSVLNADRPIEELRTDLKTLRKSEKRLAPRQILADLKIEHQAVYVLGRIYQQLRRIATADDKKNLGRRQRAQIMINPDFTVSIAESVLLTVKNNPDDANFTDVIAALAIATGRRLTELCKTAQFRADESMTPNTVIFSGQLKTKDRKLLGDAKPYAIPTLVDRDLVISGIEWVRGQQKESEVSYLDGTGHNVRCKILGQSVDDIYHNRAVSYHYKNQVADAVRRLFRCRLISIKEVRAAYTEIGYDLYKRTGESRSAYRTRVLGHAIGEDGEASSSQLHYETFTLSRDVETAQVIDPEMGGDCNKAFVAYLKKHSSSINEWLRSPAGQRIHHWLVAMAENGLSPDKVNSKWIRTNCLEEGKRLNTNTIDTYLAKIEWSEAVITALMESQPEKQPDDETDDDVDVEVDEDEFGSEDQDEDEQDEGQGEPEAGGPDEVATSAVMATAPIDGIQLQYSKRGGWHHVTAWYEGQQIHELDQKGSRAEAEQSARREAERKLRHHLVAGFKPRYKPYQDGDSFAVEMWIGSIHIATGYGPTSTAAALAAFNTAKGS